MINPNQTKSVFWLIIILVIIALVAGGIYWYRKRKATVVINEPENTPETLIEEEPQE